MSPSMQQKLSRVRSPRVHISYEVETGGANRRKELPFKVGVLAPLAGTQTSHLKPLRERKMISIDRDNFDMVMEAMRPELAFKVPNTLQDESGKLSVDMSFTSLGSFGPLSVVSEIPELAAVFGKRSRLRDFVAKLDGNDVLSDLMGEIVADDERLSALAKVFQGAQKAMITAQAMTDADARAEAVLAAVPASSREEGSDIASILHDARMILDASQTAYALELIGEFVAEISTAKAQLGDADVNLNGILVNRIAGLDAALGRQLNHILHNADFQALEASWRGLHHLTMKSETGSSLKIHVLAATFEELYRDLDKAVEFDQSALFKTIYEDEFGTFGGEPYSLLVGDYQFGRSSRDITFLERISQIAAAAHVPFISSAYAKLFDLEDFNSLHKPRDLSKIFESAELSKWRNFRDSEDSRYVTLTLPKVMMRLPYHHESNPVGGMVFDEEVGVNVFKTDDSGQIEKDADGHPVLELATDAFGNAVEITRKQTDSSKLLWGNPAYLLALNINAAFTNYGWTAAIRGVDGGGLVSGLPAYTYETEDGEITLNCPTQVAITDRREKELNDLGFMSLCHCKGTNKAAFFGGQSTNKPKQYLTSAASKNAEVSAMLPYMLASSRFAHYIKVMMRERIGSFSTGQNIQDYLNNWISQYVLLDDTAPQAVKARYPLREARVDVTENEDRVGSFKATVFLRPHFQLEELSTSIRLVADLPA
jgi:type VI secretion system protein ImpC